MPERLIYICEDHQIVIDGVKSILESEEIFDSFKSFRSAKEMLESLHDESPDLLILDLNLPDINGLEVLKEIRSVNSQLKILIFTMHVDAYLVKKVKSMGANGYLLKDFGTAELLEAIESIFAGEYYISPSLQDEENSLNDASKFRLTLREKEIISYSAEGRSSSEIAELLYLSPHTINTHRRNIYKKLGLTNIKELIKFAYDEGLA